MKRFAGPSRMKINTYEIKTVNLTSISESAKLSEALRPSQWFLAPVSTSSTLRSEAIWKWRPIPTFSLLTRVKCELDTGETDRTELMEVERASRASSAGTPALVPQRSNLLFRNSQGSVKMWVKISDVWVSLIRRHSSDRLQGRGCPSTMHPRALTLPPTRDPGI